MKTIILPLLEGRFYYVFGNKGCQDTTNTFFAKYKDNCFGYTNKIIAPNIFSTNNDAINDFFEFFVPALKSEYYNSTSFPDVELLVFERWGKMVFYDKGQSKKFDGAFNGRELPNGQYAYKIKHNDGRLKDINGSFEIRR